MSQCPAKGTSWHMSPFKDSIQSAYRQSDQSSMGALWKAKVQRFFRWKTKTQIRLCRCADSVWARGLLNLGKKAFGPSELGKFDESKRTGPPF